MGVLEAVGNLVVGVGLLAVAAWMLAPTRWSRPKQPQDYVPLPQVPLETDIQIRHLMRTRAEWSPRSNSSRGSVASSRIPSKTSDLPSGTGVVYILINPSIPELVKIGLSRRTAADRAREIAGTGVAADFIVAFENAVVDCVAAERRVHDVLHLYRVNARREFFRIPLADAVRIVASVCDEINAAARTSVEQPVRTTVFTVTINCLSCNIRFEIKFPNGSVPPNCPQCGSANAETAAGRALLIARRFELGDASRGAPRDVARAMTCYQQAATWGNAEAAAWLARRGD